MPKTDAREHRIESQRSSWALPKVLLFKLLAVRHAKGGRDSSLDMVRGVAILLAVGWHFNLAENHNPILQVIQYPGLRFGWAGVDLFFVLSGFLIGRGIFVELERSGHFRLRRFLTRRFFRLWPVLLLFLLVHVAMADRPWQSFLPQTVFCVQNYFPTTIPILWSLAVEEHFYLVIGVGFLFFPELANRPRLMTGSLVALLLLAPALRFIGWANGASPVSLQLQTQFRADALAAGLLLAATLHFRPAWFRWIAARSAILVTAVLAGCFLLSQMKFLGMIMSTVGYSVAWATAAAFLLLFSGIRLGPKITFVAAPLIYCGIYAYAFYIWQFAGLAVGHSIGRHLHFSEQGGFQLFANYLSAFILAGLITVFIEQPFIRLGKRFTGSV